MRGGNRLRDDCGSRIEDICYLSLLNVDITCTSLVVVVVGIIVAVGVVVVVAVVVVVVIAVVVVVFVVVIVVVGIIIVS